MELNIFEVQKIKIAEVVAVGVVINTPQDALDLMATASQHGARNVILFEKNLLPEFFELRTGVAGEILQKFSNYHMKLAIIGDFTKFQSKSLQAFIRESNRGTQIFFVPDHEIAVLRITR